MLYKYILLYLYSYIFGYFDSLVCLTLVGGGSSGGGGQVFDPRNGEVPNQAMSSYTNKHPRQDAGVSLTLIGSLQAPNSPAASSSHQVSEHHALLGKPSIAFTTRISCCSSPQLGCWPGSSHSERVCGRSTETCLFFWSL